MSAVKIVIIPLLAPLARRLYALGLVKNGD